MTSDGDRCRRPSTWAGVSIVAGKAGAAGDPIFAEAAAVLDAVSEY